jgi:hypothetical protein
LVHFDIREIVSVGDRVFVLWQDDWGDGHLR